MPVTPGDVAAATQRWRAKRLHAPARDPGVRVTHLGVEGAPDRPPTQFGRTRGQKYILNGTGAGPIFVPDAPQQDRDPEAFRVITKRDDAMPFLHSARFCARCQAFGPMQCHCPDILDPGLPDAGYAGPQGEIYANDEGGDMDLWEEDDEIAEYTPVVRYKWTRANLRKQTTQALVEALRILMRNATWQPADGMPILLTGPVRTRRLRLAKRVYEVLEARRG